LSGVVHNSFTRTCLLVLFAFLVIRLPYANYCLLGQKVASPGSITTIGQTIRCRLWSPRVRYRRLWI